MSPNPATPTAGGARQRLLDACVAHLARHGVADVSLRGLAEAVGTSHRMLLYHFGSREGLLAEVVKTVEAEQRAALADLAADGSLSPLQRAWRMWERFADPSLAGHERLFFELYARALQGQPGTEGLLDEVVHAWLRPLTELAVEHGVPTADAPAQARLSVAVARGLLLDLLATGERDALDEAMRRFLATFDLPATSPG